MNHSVQCFISYSHVDADEVVELRRYLETHIGADDVSLWYDRMIDAGTEWSPEIEGKLLDAKLVIFCLSDSFLTSSSCMEEFRKSIHLRRTRNTQILPIVMRGSDWLECREISRYQVLPTYGKPLEDYEDKNVAYDLIVQNLKNRISLIKRRDALTFTPEHIEKLESIDSLLSISGSSLLKLKLSDLYVEPELNDFRFESDDNVIAAHELVDKLIDGAKIIISGAAQSGKSSLCKRMCYDLFDKSFYPVLLTAANSYLENPKEVIQRALSVQYTDSECITLDRVVIILDDFYKGKRCDRFLESIPKVHSVLAVFDDIYYFNLRNVKWLSEFDGFGIAPMRARKRNALIIRWLESQNDEHHEPFDNYKSRDRLVDNVELMLGRTLGKGIIPAYPFFILSLIITSEVTFKPIDRQITSQGYCYQALIHAVLRKVGVDNLHVDFYIMFLTELAYMLYKNNTSMTCTEEELASFIKKYKQEYNLPLPERAFIETLAKARIFQVNSIGNGDFSYSYLKYYFIGKKFSEQYVECKDDIANVVSNLRDPANAYIAVFIALQGSNEPYLDDLSQEALSLYKDIMPCYLTKQDLDGFEQRKDLIVRAALPQHEIDPEKRREEILAEKERRERDEEWHTEEDDTSDITIALRLCQVIGIILKCRPGSIRKEKQKSMINVIVDLHGRLVRDFLDTFKDEKQQKSIIDYLTYKFRKSRIEPGACDVESDRKAAQKWFWNVNFMVMFGLVLHCANSIGSSELYSVIKECYPDSVSVPFLRVLPYLVQILFKKRIDVDGLGMAYKSLPETMRTMLRFVVVRFYETHRVPYKERQQIENLLDFKPTLPAFLKNDRLELEGMK